MSVLKGPRKSALNDAAGDDEFTASIRNAIMKIEGGQEGG